jgi:hypothetical protein
MSWIRNTARDIFIFWAWTQKCVGHLFFEISQIFPEMQESNFRTKVAVVMARPITSYKPFFLLHVDQLESDLVVLVDLKNFSLLKRSKI